MQDKIEILTVRCGACPHRFQHVETGKGVMQCPKCKAVFIRKPNGDWVDKKINDLINRDKKSCGES